MSAYFLNLEQIKKVGGHLKVIFVSDMVKIGCFFVIFCSKSAKKEILPIYHHHMETVVGFLQNYFEKEVSDHYYVDFLEKGRVH